MTVRTTCAFPTPGTRQFQGGDDHAGSVRLIELEHAATKAVCKFAVRPNLADFLDHLASSRHIAGSVYIWIDALCVNQSDLGERAQQVGLMKRIFTQCTETIVWLGIESADSRLAVELIEHLDSIAPDTYDEYDGWVPSHDAVRLAWKRTGLALDKFQSEHWSALGSLIERNWFHRVWTIQEYFLPPLVAFWCGEETFHVQGLARSLGLLGGPCGTPSLTPKMNWSTFCQVRNMVSKRTKNRDFSVSTLIYWARLRGCSDKRDTVYGVLGLSSTEMDADYTRQPGDVFTTYANAVGPRFLVPHDVESPKYRRTPNLPSWVPDFAVPTQPAPWIVMGLNRKYRAGGHHGAHGEQDSETQERDSIAPLPSTNPRVLAVMGTAVDGVKVASGTWDGVPTGQFLVDALAAITALPQTSCGVPILEQLRETLIVGKTSGDVSWWPFMYFLRITLARWLSTQDRAEADQQSLHSVLEKLRHTPRGVDIPTWAEIVALSRTLSGKSYKEQCNYGVGNEQDNIKLQSYLDTFEALFVDRRFFVTSGGRMGVGPDNLAKGAVVCVIQNLDFPLLLDHGSEGRYRLLGVCYVSGIMHGEALEGREFTRIEIE
ncbi:HET-domain-containing protein [Apiospora saccharicola]|uniref:HET-domain-containing protein n=1 Tax=Apiospora saccharicola TaxID=335842 RepID=A0ABR1UG21_9PEZI